MTATPEAAVQRAELVLQADGAPEDLAAIAASLPAGSRERARVELLLVRLRARKGDPDGARVHLESLRADAGAEPVDLLLADAALGHPERRRLWREALALLGPDRHTERLDVLLNLAEADRQGGDLLAARRWFEEAHALAEGAGDLPRRAHTAALVGNFLVEVGLLDRAEVVLRECVTTCRRLELTLLHLAEASILLGLLLRSDRLDEAEAVAEGLAVVAEHRGHWLALADARIVQSACELKRGAEGDAVRRLVVVGQILRGHGAAAAFHLVKARLAELRAVLGPDRFDPWFQHALGLASAPA